MHAWRVTKIAAGGVLFLIVVGLVADAAEGLPWSRTAPMPFAWIGGLFLGGLATVVFSLLFEGSGERTFEMDNVADPLGRRVLRATCIGLALGAIPVIVLLLRASAR
jgi:hypothetical protein